MINYKVVATKHEGILAALLSEAKLLDKNDPLREFRGEFHIPVNESGEELSYFCGNSLGLAPKDQKHLDNVMKQWHASGINSYWTGNKKGPNWVDLGGEVNKMMAPLVGGNPDEVVVTDSLGNNLHKVIATFYEPKGDRTKVLMLKNEFPTDVFIVKNWIKLKGSDKEENFTYIGGQDPSAKIETSEIIAAFEKYSKTASLLVMSPVNYLTGQAYPIKEITAAAHQHDIKVIFDLAHTVGNSPLSLHEWNVDAAVWCTYKYLNSGPAGIGGLFVHNMHAEIPPALSGWWGSDPDLRFEMSHDFTPDKAVNRFQISAPSAIKLAMLKTALEIFTRAGMKSIYEKSLKMTRYFRKLIEKLDDVTIITPEPEGEHGAQLSIQVKVGDNKKFVGLLLKERIIVDYREQGQLLRITPIPLYTRYEDIFIFVQKLKKMLRDVM